MKDFPVVKLRSLDKITARTQTFEAHVGSTIRFGSLYIKAQSCRKTSPIEKSESAAFLQIWENASGATDEASDQSEWVFSGWMFASAPGLSFMDHPVYDVWVLDCLTEKGETTNDADFEDELRAGEGELDERAAPSVPEIEGEKAEIDTTIEVEQLPAE